MGKNKELDLKINDLFTIVTKSLLGIVPIAGPILGDIQNEY